IGFHVRNRIVDRRYDVADPGEMEHVCGTGENTRAGLELADVLPVARKIGVARQVLQIAAVAAGEVINHPDGKSLLDEQVNHVAADETSAAGYDRRRLAGHAALSRL